LTPELRRGNCAGSVHGRAPRPHSGFLHSAWVCFSQSYLASCTSQPLFDLRISLNAGIGFLCEFEAALEIALSARR